MKWSNRIRIGEKNDTINLPPGPGSCERLGRVVISLLPPGGISFMSMWRNAKTLVNLESLVMGEPINEAGITVRPCRLRNPAVLTNLPSPGPAKSWRALLPDSPGEGILFYDETPQT